MPNGEELSHVVSENVFEQYKVETYVEAGYKPYIIAAMIFNSKFEDAAALLKGILKDSKERVKTV